MVEHSSSRNRKTSGPATDRSPARQQPEALLSMQRSASGGGPFGLSAQNILHMQRVVGNQAVQRMFASSHRTDKPVIQRAGEADAASASAATGAPVPATQAPAQLEAAPAAPESAALSGAPAAVGPAQGPAAVPAPAPKRGPSPKDLSNFQNYHVVYKWLKARAEHEKKSALFGFFDDLSAGEKVFAIKKMCNNERSPTIEKVKDTMLTGVFTKTLDWDRFSEISREAKEKNIRNYNADEARDYASYTAIGTSAAAGGVSGGATVSNGLGAGGALGVANAAAPVAGVLSGVSAVSQMYNATQNYDSSLSTVGKGQQVGTEGAGGAADLARFTAGTVSGVEKLGGMAVNGAATVAAGAAGIIGGAAYLAGGVAGYVESGRNQQKLGALETQFNARAGADERQRQLGLAANLGGSTQAMNKSKSATTAAKGALMIAGGAMLIAAAASPVGPILLAAAAIVGGIGALIKFYKKSKRKEAFVDKAFNIEQETAKPENAGLGKDKVRQNVLEAHGFNNVDQCYAQIVTDLATMLYEGGVTGQDEECVAVIEGLGLKVDKAKKKPGKDLIAKKLHT